MRNFRQRLKRLKLATAGRDILFRLATGARAVLRRGELLPAYTDALRGADSRGARIMLSASKASDKSRLHELAQTIRDSRALVLEKEVRNERL